MSKTLRPWGFLALSMVLMEIESLYNFFKKSVKQLAWTFGGEICTDDIVDQGRNLMSHCIFATMDLQMVLDGRII
jgi:hypothetical protein